MKKIKKVLFLLIILTFIVITIIQVIKIKQKNNIINEELYNSEEAQDYISVNMEFVQEKNVSNFFTINDLINNFIQYINNGNENAVRAILGNIYESNYKDINYSNFYIQNIFTSQNLNNGISYVYGLAKKGDHLENSYFILFMDYINNTFEIIPCKEEDFNNVLKGNGEKVKEKTINKNEYNSYSLKNVSLEERCEVYYNDFLIKIDYNIEKAYNLIEENYRNSKFSTIELFKEYVKNKKIELNNTNIQKVEYNYTDKYMEFNCITNNGKKYIIREFSLMDYKIMLDSYTIENEKFIDEYDKFEPKEKVVYNIDKVITMINNKDYETIYNLLDNGFKKNYFKTENSFEEYIKQNLFETNYLSDLNIREENNIYICTCQIKEKNTVSARQKNITLYMEIEEKGFVISINMQ